MDIDLSYLEALMGGPAEEAGGGTGGVWVVSPDGLLDDGVLRLVGKARVLADALGAYVYLLLGGNAGRNNAQRAVQAGANSVLLASGVPSRDDLAGFFRERSPQVVLFPRTRLGRTLAPGLAHELGGGLAGYTADLAVDPIYQRVIARQPILEDAARLNLSILASPAVALVDTGALPAAFSEPWRTGNVEETGLVWPMPTEYPPVTLPAIALTLATAPVVVAVGRGLGDEAGLALAERLAAGLGGVVAGDLGALDAGWIDENQLVGITGHQVAPRLYLALGIDGDTGHFMAIEGAKTIVAVQPDPAAPIVSVADYNILADPKEFAEVLLAALSA